MSIYNTEHVARILDRLLELGIKPVDGIALRRISMTLHRWFELECGDNNNWASWAIVRGRKINGQFEHDDDGDAYEERHVYTENKPRYTKLPDREKGARKRLAAIMERYPALTAYVQTDPRGCALYVLRKDDIPNNSDISCCYNRGIAIHK